MKNSIISMFLSMFFLLNLPVFSQTEAPSEEDSTLLGLPGDNLDLYAVMDLFQKSKTIEAFEKSLNEEKTGINNLDLNLDDKVDFIKVETKKKGEDFTFILQVDVSKTEKQDVAVILVSKDKNGKVTLQIVGDKALYGKDYIVEPKSTATPASTPNPAYSGSDPVKVPVPASTTTVIIEQTPIVQYVYSPAYVPYVPPYYYGFYPPYFAAFTVMAVGIYRHNNYYYHGGGYGHGYHGNTTVIHNTNNYNNYNNSRNSSNTVNHNNASGKYNRNNASTRPTGGASGSTRPSTTPSTRPAGGASASTRPSNTASNRQPGGVSASDRQSNPSVSNRQSGQTSSTRESGQSSRQSRQSVSNRQGGPSSSNSYNSGNRSGGNRNSGGYSGGGGRSGSGFSGGGGGRGGGGSRGGGGRR